MAQHPPWLRFQAYVVGLPKTGSTSIATVFGNYRSGHEWELMRLVGAGLARSRGELTDAQFLAVVGDRLEPAALEMDSATSHYLYTDVLRERFPRAVFVHTVRDVRSWVTSLLDMVLRKRLARRLVDVPYSVWESQYLDMMTEGNYDLDPERTADDGSSVPALMRYWAGHMRQMADHLPADRSLQVPTREIHQRIADLAALVGVPAHTLRADLAHANRAPVQFDRFAAFDGPELRATYDEYCADIMASVFPVEHATWQADMAAHDAGRVNSAGWDAYLADSLEWVQAAVAAHGPQSGR